MCRTRFVVVHRLAATQAPPDMLDGGFPFLCLSLYPRCADKTAAPASATLEPMKIRRSLVLVGAVLLAPGAHAVDLSPGGVFVQGGVAERATYTATAGVIWPWAWRRESRHGEVTGITEAFISHWNARGADGRHSLTQVGLLPMFRYRGDHGRSAWFVEGGIGISLMDQTYTTPTKQFSTRFNFVDVVGVGRSFGPQRGRELSLRVTHVSNAGIKKPNPGENLLQLRYAVLF